MRIEFRERPDDLLLVAAASVALLSLVLSGLAGIVRFALAVLFIFVMPGYAIVAAVFPKDGEVPWLERIALSVGLSLATVALLGVVLDATPWGVRLDTIVVAVLVFNLGMCAFAYWRRMRLTAHERLGLAVQLAAPRWRDLAPTDRVLAVGLAVSIIFGAAALVVLSPAPARESFTEFYLLDASGGLSAYPTELNASQPGVIILGVANHESRVANYTIVVRLVAVRYVYNQTTRGNDTVELWNSTLDTIPLSLADTERSESPYTFRIANPGDYQVRFALYLGVPQGTPYRSLRLVVHVV